MNLLEKYGIRIPDLLLPAEADLKSWAVIACDQYTQDREYWKSVERIVGDKPSTLHLTLPEIYLNSPDKEQRIKNIRKTMTDYLKTGVFAPEKKSFIYVERRTAYNRLRRGLIAAIDLDTYDWKPFSKSFIRSTEATIKERIPPRMEIRRDAPIELPHIMLLINDPDHRLVEGTGDKVKSAAPAYNGELMQNGGSITGWYVNGTDNIRFIEKTLETIAIENICSDGSTFLFAVGDGNHSLATAKAVWDEYKTKQIAAGIPEEKLKNHNARYALVEIVNLYDPGLTFEPIHRVLFGTDPEKLIHFVAEKLKGSFVSCSDRTAFEKKLKEEKGTFGFVYKKEDIQKYISLATGITELGISRLQPILDEYMQAEAKNSRIDFIHGTEEVFRLGSQEGTVSILLQPIAKDSFFKTISNRGPLPRKSFSMGEADEKRFYLECRKLF